MKNLFMLILTVLLGISLHAQQVERDMVVYEGGTGFWWGYCPGAALGAVELVEYGHNVAVIENHNGDSLANNYSNARNSYYGITGYPTVFFDGILSVVGGSGSSSMYSSYVPKVDQRNAVMSDFTIDVEFEGTDGDYMTTIVIDNVGGSTATNLVLQVVITESKLPIVWGLTDVQDFVNRLMVPDQNGTPLDFTGGSTQTIELDFSTGSWWDIDNCEIVAFVQNNTTKEILQGTKKFMAVPLYNIDAQAKAVNYPVGLYCGNIVEPVVLIKNMGSEDLTTLDIEYSINGGASETFAWTGDLGFNLGEEIELPELTFSPETTNTFEFTVSNPNGQPDPNPDNNSLSTNFDAAPVIPTAVVNFELKTDNYPEETTWEVTNSAGEILYSGGPYTNSPNTVFTEVWEFIESDCYTYTIFDVYGDGICCDYGIGYYKLMDENNIVFAEGGEFGSEDLRPFERTGGNTASQTIYLANGYKFISSHIISENPDMIDVLQDVLNDDLDFVRNSLGQTLRQIGPNWVNNIGDWIVDEGYLVKMFADNSFTIDGLLVDPSTPIILPPGFKFISYFPESAMDALIAFGTIIGDDLDFIRNSQGQTLRKIGPNWVNGIGDCMPGEGYLVKMYADGEIIYPATAKSSGKVAVVPSHFDFEGGNAADPVFTIYVEGLEIGDEVAAYEGNVMVGSTVIVSENTLENSLPIFSTLTSQKGYVNGNNIILKVWDDQLQNQVSSTYTLVDEYEEAYFESTYPSEDGEFSVINITKGSSDNIDVETNVSIYPNPASDVLNVVANTNIKRVRIINFIGQIMFDNSVNNSSININTSVYQSGVYIISVETSNGVITEKITIK